MVALGHYVNSQGQSAFRVFAPVCQALALCLEDQDEVLPMQRQRDGYWTLTLPRLADGRLYRYEVDGQRWPDPASRSQPAGVHGPSMVSTPRRAFSPGWQGVGIDEAVIYELHLGTFTPEGTLSAARRKLPYLQELGINVIELMPIAEFPGNRNWGYDGTYLFALQHTYGDYYDLQAFIEDAHQHGIAVILDVVYNHFGPEGNYSGFFAPYTKQADTPWGAAINFDQAHHQGIRDFYLANTRYWLQDIGFDGFRMDAVSLVFDHSSRSILREITDLSRTIAAEEGREILMIAEHLRNESQVTAAEGLSYQSQWNDDLNHALFRHLTGESGRHYSSFQGFADIEKALRDSFVLDGTREHHFYQRLYGTDGRHTAATEHVMHIQNHDQIGNRPYGDRLISSYGRDKQLLAATTLFASPYVPMIFMGEEYGESAPFLFFEDFGDPQLVEAVRVGRQREFAYADGKQPDSHALASFLASKLQWLQLEDEEHQMIHHYYRMLIQLKREGRLGPRDKQKVGIACDADTQLICIQTDDSLTLLNFSDRTHDVPVDAGWTLVLSSNQPGEAGIVPPYSAHVYLKLAD